MSPFDEFLSDDELALVSCCNVGHGGSRYSVAVLSSEGIDWLDLDEVIEPGQDKGITGVLATEDHCFLAVPGQHERIISLDHRLQPVDVFSSKLARDLHSLAIHEGRLYYASTGRNQVLSVAVKDGRFSGPERVHVTRESTTEDLVHLNSLLIDDGSPLLYSMFGVGPRSPIRDKGAVVEAHSGQMLLSGLMDPHSLTRLPDGRIALCESYRSALCVVTPQTGRVDRVTLRGYTRGIAHTGKHLLVGASHWRGRSRSSLETREMPDSFAAGRLNHCEQSYLFVVRADLTLAHTIDFTEYGREIYDVAFLGTRFQAASVFHNAIERRRETQKPAWPLSLVKAMRG